MGGVRALDSAGDRAAPRRNGEERRRRQAILAGLAVLCLLNAGDLITTRVILDHSGVLEANPVARALLAYYRVDVLKGAILIILVWVALRSRATTGVVCAVWFACGYYTLAVISNGLLIAALP